MISSGYKSLILMLAVGAITNVANAMPTEDLPEFSLEKLVVSATKVPTTMFNANANVNVVGRQEIENKHFNNIGEAIRNLPGVNVQNMGGSGEAYADNTLYINGSKNAVFMRSVAFRKRLITDTAIMREAKTYLHSHSFLCLRTNDHSTR